MPIIRRSRYEAPIEDMEELYGAEMQPYLSGLPEEEPNEVQEKPHNEGVPIYELEELPQRKKFWTKLRTLFHSENW